MYEIAGEGELNGVTDKSGNPATNGYTRVKNAMFAKAYQDENLLQQFTESNEMPIKNVFTAMQNAALFIVRYNNAVKDGAAFEYPISQVIVQAAKTIMQRAHWQGNPAQRFPITLNRTHCFRRNISGLPMK